MVFINFNKSFNLYTGNFLIYLVLYLLLFGFILLLIVLGISQSFRLDIVFTLFVNAQS